MTEDSLIPFDFPAVRRKKVTAGFDGGLISSDGGLVLLREAERRLRLADTLAGSMRDRRDPATVVHTLPAMLRFCMFAIACGYEDADDCDALRTDPLFKLAVGRAPESGRALCSQPTMSRLENAPSRREVARMTAALVDLFCRSFSGPPAAINNVEFRDTGVLLTVTPRVNPGGLVVLELEQEVSDVAPGSANSLTPIIQQRKIVSTVAVQSGETVVLGGLIRENENEIQSGVPFFSEIPVIGQLFRSNVEATRRTELVVLITPRAVQGAAAARRITEELRSKMNGLEAFLKRSAPDPSSPDEPGQPGQLGQPEEQEKPSPGPSAAGREP